MNRIEKALANATQTRALRLGRGVADGVATVFKEQFGERRALVVADRTTWQVAGERVSRLLEAEGVAQDPPYIFDEPEFHAEWKYIDRLEAVLRDTGAIPVAVGSGTVNDLTKLSSDRTGRRYMIVATAASMDGYVAFGASITKDGCKQTFPCAAPQAVVADVDIIATAPTAMTASGYADLFAKVPAGADWILADALGIEPIDPLAFGIVQDGLHDALADPAGARHGDPVAIEKLIEGLLLGGFAMQAYPKSSRPASGADHQFSHLLNMENFVMKNGQAPSHGFQVSIGTLVSLACYEQLLQADVDAIDVEACVAAWPSLEVQEQRALEMFRGTDFPLLGATEIKAKYIGPDALRSEIERFKATWNDTKQRLQGQLVSVADAVARLKPEGAPTQPEDIDLPRERLRRSIIPAQHIRRRYTILDLGVRTRLLDRWTDAVFGQNGLWEIA